MKTLLAELRILCFDLCAQLDDRLDDATCLDVGTDIQNISVLPALPEKLSFRAAARNDSFQVGSPGKVGRVHCFAVRNLSY